MASDLIEITVSAVASAIFTTVFISTIVLALGTILLAIKLIVCAVERFKDWRENRGK